MRERVLPRRLATGALVVGAALVAGLALLHLRMVRSPAPQEMREGAALWITGRLLDGHDIYDLRELPGSTNVYGILYHLVVWPFARIFGNTFPVHRAVSGVAIVLAAGLMYRIVRRRGADRGLALVGAMLFYVSSLYFVAPLARPDGLAVFLCVSSLFVLFDRSLTPLRAALGIALALGALATKIPLAFPPFVVAAYLFLFRSRRQGLQLGIAAVGSALLVLLLLVWRFPSYLNLSLVTNSNANYDGGAHLVTQTRDWILFSLPLPVALAAGWRARAWRSDPRVATAPPLALSDYAFASAANAVVFLGWLGWHPGAHMTYLFQLVTPVLIPAVLPGLTTHAWPRALTCVAFPAALLLNAHYFPLRSQRFADAEVTFARLERAIASHERVLGSTDVAGPLVRAGRDVVDSGQSEYFAFAAATRSLPWLMPGAALQARWDAFMSALASDITSRRYDLVIRSRKWGLIPEDLVAEHYRVRQTVEIDFVWSGQRWPLDLWEPTSQPE